MYSSLHWKSTHSYIPKAVICKMQQFYYWIIWCLKYPSMPNDIQGHSKEELIPSCTGKKAGKYPRQALSPYKASLRFSI